MRSSPRSPSAPAARSRSSVFQHLFSLSLRYHLERRTGELARAIDRGVKAVSFMLGTMLFNIVPTLLEFALVIGILLVEYHWVFALITFVTIVAYAAFTIVATEWRIAFRREMNARDNEVSAQAVDSLLNYETVKAFTNEGYERDRLDRTLAAYERAAVKSDAIARRAQLRPGGDHRARRHRDHDRSRRRAWSPAR